MKMTEPKIEDRKAQPYVAIRTQVPMNELPNIIPQCIDETEAWLGAPGEVPFIRYHVIDMAGLLDIEVGWVVTDSKSGDSRVSAGVIPAGRYASLIYTDVAKGIEGNRALIEWAKTQGHEWDAWDTEQGHTFAGRFEFFLTGPADDPDPANWDTEVAIRLAD